MTSKAAPEPSQIYRDIVEVMSDAVYVHRDGTIVWCNAAAERMFGASPEDSLVGKLAWDLIGDVDRDRVIANYTDLGPSEKPKLVHVVRRRLDGSEFPSEAYGASIDWEGAPATMMVIRDLSEQTRLRQQLAEVSARELDFAHISPDAILVHLYGTIVFVNPAACEMFRAATPHELIGRDIRDLVHPETRSYIENNWSAAEASVDDKLVGLRRLRLDGTEFIGEGRHRFVSWNGEPAVLVAIRDATPRIDARDALKRSGERHREALDALPDPLLIHIGEEIVYANRAAIHEFSAPSREMLIGMSICDLVHPDDRMAFRLALPSTDERSAPTVNTLRRLRLDGSTFIGETRRIASTWEEQDAFLVVIRNVTERQLAEHRLKSSEARHRAVLDRLPDAVFAHVDGVIHYANQAAVEQYRAKSIEDLIGRNMAELVHPDDRDNLRRNWTIADIHMPNFVVTRRRLRLDGTTFEGEARRIGDSWDGEPGFIVVIQDVTERLDAERTLQESAAQYRAIAEVNPVPLMVHVAGRIVYANPAAIGTFAGNGGETLIGRKVDELVHPDDRSLFSTISRHAEMGERQPIFDARFIVADGGEMVAEAIGCGYVWNNAPAKLLIVRDVSQRKRTEVRLRQARQAAEHANEMKSRFFARMSHELRTPLNSILGFSEVIESELFGSIDNEKYIDYAGDIQKSGRHLLSLIDDLLDLSKAEAGRYELRESEFDLSAQLRENLHMIAPLAERKRITITENIPESQRFIYAGEREIRQVVTNLLSNAVKFTPEGGKIDVSLSFYSPEGIVVEIVDNGIGIAPADMSKLFSDYTQVGDPFRTSDQKGSGLGLALCRQFAELHGGEIRLDSAPGHGTRATFILPAMRRITLRKERELARSA